MRWVSFFIAPLFLPLLLPAGASALVPDYQPASVGAGLPEVHIKRDGTISIKSARVEQVLGTTFYIQVKWGGNMSMRFTMKTSGKTEVVKKYGGVSSIGAIRQGDYLDAEGDLVVGSDFFGVDAKTVKDWSLQEESGTFSGAIVELNPDNFVLRTPTGAILSVQATTSGVSIKKGAISVPWSRLAKGDTVLLADGIYDYTKNVLTARQIIVFQSAQQFAPRNYEGTLKSIESVRVPTTLTVSVAGADYSVRVSERTLVLKKNRSPAELPRFVAGDTVRFYGPLREEEKTLRDEHVVDAEIVRNLNL